MTIQFFDCPNCGKSLRVGAPQCHHCNACEADDWGDPNSEEGYAEGGYADDASEREAIRETWKRRFFTVVVVLLLISFALQMIPTFFPMSP